MNRLVFKYDFDTPTGSVTTNVEFDPIDISWADQLYAELYVTTADTDATDTMNVYVQSRTENGVWDDRIAFTQVNGTTVTPKTYGATLQKFGTLADDEEESEVSSSSGTRLTAGTVKNGPFPRPLRRGQGISTVYAGSNMVLPAWRVSFVGVEASTTNADFKGTLRIYADDAAS